MALTKSPTPLVSKASGANASGNTATGSGVEIKNGVAGIATITNGASGPTTPCGLYLDYSADNTNWVNRPLIGLGDTANNAITPIPFRPDPEWNYYRTRFTGNTGQSVTVEDAASRIETL